MRIFMKKIIENRHFEIFCISLAVLCLGICTYRAIATCIMELIIGLLSIDAVKYRLQPTTLVKIQEVFTVAKQTSERLV